MKNVDYEAREGERYLMDDRILTDLLRHAEIQERLATALTEKAERCRREAAQARVAAETLRNGVRPSQARVAQGRVGEADSPAGSADRG